MSIKEQFTRAFQAWSAVEKENRAKVLEQRAARASTVPDTVYFCVNHVSPTRVRAETIAGMPDGADPIVTYGADVDEALFEARHELLAVAWNSRLPGEEWATVRHRVATTKLIPSTINVVR